MHDRILVDLDMRESGIQYGKRSFMNCEVTLYQKNELSVDSEELISELSDVTKIIVNEVLDPNEYFNFHKSKK